MCISDWKSDVCSSELEAAIAGYIGDDLPCEREEKARALDEENGQHVLLRETGYPEDAAVDELRREDDLLAFLGFDIEGKHHVEIRFGKRIGVDVHIDVDRRGLVARSEERRVGKEWGSKGKF